jgi:hypothetical protein
VSPIFVRPVREQLEHDRLIRHLQAKYKRKFDVATNVGDEQIAPVKIGANTFFPDLVLTTDRKLAGLVEVESGESVNNLEAMAQWVHFSRAKVPFHLYVPVQVYDSARRLCEANQARVTEIWTYRAVVDGFDLVRIYADASASAAAARQTPDAKPPANIAKASSAPPVKPAKPSKPKAAKRPVPAKGRKKPPARPVRTVRSAGRSKRR